MLRRKKQKRSRSAEGAEKQAAAPKGLRRRLGRLVERVFPLKWADFLAEFWMQTRLMFSRTIFLLIAAMFVLFASSVFDGRKHLDEKAAFLIALVQTMILTVLLHMSLWETERERRTFELLIMRVPGIHRLIWLKLRVSLFWTLVLPPPFFAAFAWFLSIPVGRCVVYLLFIQVLSMLIALQTCVVASFVHRALPTGILSIILFWMTAGFVEEARGLPYRDFYRFMLSPFDEQFDKMALFEYVKILAVNRAVLLLAAAGFYWWFHERLKKTEKWIR